MKTKVIKKRLIIVFILTLILAISMLGVNNFFIPQAKAESGVDLTIETTPTYSTNYEGEISLVISAKNTSKFKIYGVSFWLNYNPVFFQFVRADIGPVLNDPDGGINGEQSGKVIVGLNKFTQTNLPNFIVATIVFRLKENAVPSNYAFNFTDCAASTFDNDTSEIPASGIDKTITITEPSSAADLTSLTVKNGSTPLSGTWTTGGMTVPNSVYTVTAPVNFTVSTVNITAAVSPSAKLEVSGSLVTGGSAKDVNLTVGANSITVKVTAQDGKKINNFTVKITRQAGDSNTDLQLSVKNSSGTIYDVQIESDKFTVTNTIPFVEASNIKIVPTANALSTIKVNGSTVVSGAEVNLPLQAGKNEIAIIVKSQAGTDKNYTLVLNVAQPNVANTLSELKLEYSDGTPIDLNVPFNPEMSMYYAKVKSDVTTIKVSAKTSHPDSIIISGTGDQSVSEIIEIVVQAQNGDLKKYQIVIVPIIVTEEDNIKDVVINGEGIDFKADQYFYEIKIKGNVDKIEVGFVAGEGVTVGVYGNENLKAGRNTVLLTVAQQDGTIVTYTINVVKPDGAKTAYLIMFIIVGVIAVGLLVTIVIQKTKSKKVKN